MRRSAETRCSTPRSATSCGWPHESALEAQPARCDGPARDPPPRRAAGARNLERFGLFAAKVPARTSDAAGRSWVEPLPRQFDARKYCAAADRIIAGEFDVFALRPAQLGFPPQWNRDPKTGRVAPLTFGKALDYRDERIVGDIKYLWEPSRHAELLTLAQAWHCRGTSVTPPPVARCWTLVRAVSVSLGSALEQQPRARDAPDQLVVRVAPARGASPLFEGATGALRALADCDLPALPFHRRPFLAPFVREQSPARRADRAVRRRDDVAILAAVEVLARNSARASCSGRRSCRTAATASIASRLSGITTKWRTCCSSRARGRANGMELGAEYWRRLEAMLDYIASIMDVGGNVPNFGDADDAIVARLDPAPDGHVYRSLLATGAVVFERPDSG